ncbi:lymphokine-activated killer T-cell-originated protein kinase homolog [Lycorma delicatula]|uniref:lymphokine-activated killer T-cell-originated protein kinase homolog n=1 Tax=Lycorma delicatula TaxID=130591 RepID=UPI003F51A9CF
METPLRCKNNPNVGKNESYAPFDAPETPFLRRLGYGTGVGVYHLDRTSLAGKSPKSPWAIKKVLRQHKNSRFGELLSNEATLLRKLNHPNIVGFRGFTKTDDGREVLAMEECTVSLGDLIEEHYDMQLKPFTTDKIFKVLYNISKALDYLHNDVFIMHGDLKSFNILIKGDFNDVKLCDFGVSIKVDKDGKALCKYIGTECWSAPEVLSDGIVTVKADVFSFGLVIYEMLALHPPHIDMFLEGEENNGYEDESLMFCGENYGKRPKLNYTSFGKEYDLVLEIYNACTEQDPDKRPSAKNLINKLESKKMKNEM